MSQNEFYIDTELNTDGIKEGAQEINKTVEEVANKTGTKFRMIGGELVDVTDKTEAEVDALKRAAEEANNLSKEMAKVEPVKLAETETDGIQAQQERWIEVGNSIVKVTGKTQEEIDEIIAARTATQELADEMQEVADRAQEVSLDGLKGVLSDPSEFLAQLEGENIQVDTTGALDFTKEIDTSALDEYLDKAQTIPQIFSNIKANIADAFTPIHNAIASNEMLANTVSRVQMMFSGLTANLQTAHPVLTLIGKAGAAAAVGVGKLAAAMGKAALHGLKLVGSGIVSGLKKIGKAAANGAKNILTLGKASNKAGGGFRQLLRYGLGISSLFVLFNKLRNALMDGMKNLAKFDKTTNASISSITSALATLKNALATGFAPILTVISPIITSFINKLSQLATAIGMVIAKLTGKNTFTKAIAQQKDYAASLDKTSKSANKQVAAFDDLNTITSQANSGGDGGVGGMFEEVPISDKASKMADWLKSMWDNADFTELGAKLGQKLADALDNIDWKRIQAAAGKLGKSLATLINGFVEVPDLGYKIGNAWAQSLNTALEFIYQFVKNLHWESIGEFIGDAVNGFFENFNWLKLADTISIGLKGVLDMVKATLVKVDWQMIGNQLWDAISHIDYAGIARSLFSLLGAALASAIELIWGFIEDAVRGIRDYFKKYIDEYIATTGEDNLGKAIIMGILNGILDALVNIALWIYDNIFTPFINGFKEAFEIHSPSKVMEQMGKFLIEGLFNGLKDIWERVQSIFANFKTKVETKFTEIKTNVQKTMEGMKTTVISIFESLKNGIKSPINTMLGCIEKFANGIIGGINKVIDTLNGLQIDVPDWVTDMFGITSFGFNIPNLSTISIPRLATGAVIPPNKEFLAVLGDQKSGTNIEAPLKTIVDAFNMASGNRTEEELSLLRQQNELLSQILYKGLSISSRDLFNSVRSEAKDYYFRTGNEAFI